MDYEDGDYNSSSDESISSSDAARPADVVDSGDPGPLLPTITLNDDDQVDVPMVSVATSTSLPSTYQDAEKNCWVCFATEEDDPLAVWVNPCRCRGTTKWVHQACIQRWVDEKQKGSYNVPVECPQCGTPYVIRFPPAPYMVVFIDSCDQFIQKLCPMITGGICVASIYWSCVTYGAVTIMQCVGHDKGLIIIEKCDPLVLLVSLPLVPVGLFMGKMIRWDQPVLKFLRQTVPKIPLSRYILPSFGNVPVPAANGSVSAAIPPVSDPISMTRTLVGALVFPTVATFLGSTLYNHFECSHLKKTILGGLTFLTVKGILKIYHKQHIFITHGQRIIMNYVDNSANSNNTSKSNSSNSVRGTAAT